MKIMEKIKTLQIFSKKCALSCNLTKIAKHYDFKCHLQSKFGMYFLQTPSSVRMRTILHVKSKLKKYNQSLSTNVDGQS